MELTPKQLNEIAKRAADIVLDRISDSLRSIHPGREVEHFTPLDPDADPLNLAVVKAIERAGCPLQANRVVHLLSDHPAIVAEKDPRMKARKVSQALYTQRKKKLRSVKEDYTTWWILAEWFKEGKVVLPHRPETATPPGGGDTDNK